MLTRSNYRKRGDYMVADKPGSFLLIDKSLLLLDERYQRTQNKEKVSVIASHWSWQACGCILVASRKVGDAIKYFVFDGGHRVEAAKKLPDVVLLPCMVFEAMSVAEEAESFLKVARERRPITGLERFKAEVTAKDATAKLVLELVHQAGRKVGKDDVACVRAIGECLIRDERIFRRIWQCVAELSIGQPLTEILVQGLFHIERNLAGGDSIADPIHRARIFTVGAQQLAWAAKKAAAYYARGGAKTWARGMLDEINKGRSVNILKLKGEE